MKEALVERPLCTIIVLTRNRAASLGRTLQALSVLDYPTYEVLVMDNGSTDSTREVANNYGVECAHCPGDQGIGWCRQQAVGLARGNIIAMCDDDCIPHRDWLDLLVQRLLSDERIGLVAGQTINIGFPESQRYKGRSRIGRNGQLHFVRDPKEAECFGSANVALRRDAFERVGGYDHFFRGAYEDPDLTLRMRKHGFQVVYEPEAVVEHYFTGISFKGRFFGGGAITRLYFYLKHFRPATLRAWIDFFSYEVWLFTKELVSIFRQIVGNGLKGNFQAWSGLGMGLINSVSARCAIPWLLWKVRKAPQ